MLRLTRQQSREVDRIAIKEYGIPSIVLMENAARSAVDAMTDLLDQPKHIAIVCGGGNNGGDGMAVARHLTNRGHHVYVYLVVEPDELRGDAATHYRILRRMEVRLGWAFELRAWFREGSISFDIVIDAIFGTGLSRPAGGVTADLIQAMADRHSPFNCPVISLDIPSGLDCDTGRPLGTCVRADRTITFAAEKFGFAFPEASQYCGQLIVGDIGVPRAVIEQAAGPQA